MLRGCANWTVCRWPSVRKAGFVTCTGQQRQLLVAKKGGNRRMHLQCRRQPASEASGSETPVSNLDGESDDALLQTVFERIASSDGGSSLAEADQASINDLLAELADRGRHQHPRPLDNPDLFGNFDVAYSSTQRAPRQSGQPAGGGFRSRLGRKVFQTTRLCQSVLQPDVVINKVEFMLFGIVNGSVGLRGKLEPLGDDKATVKALFEPPRLTLGRSIDLPIGPTSTVVLTTTYLTPTVRLGKGSRGSLFVFTKCNPSDAPEMDKVGLGRTMVAGWLWLLAILAGLTVAACRLWQAPGLGKVAAAVSGLIVLLIGRAAGTEALRRRPAS